MGNNHIHSNIEEIIHELGIKTRKYWINILSSLEPEKVGVIKSSGKLLAEPWLSQLCAEVAYLAENGFYLPMVIGGGVQYDKLPASKPSRKVNEIRVTSRELIGQMSALALENQENIVTGLKRNGVQAVAIPYPHVFAQPHGIEISPSGEKVETGYAGDVVSIDTKPIISAVYAGQVAVLTHLGIGADNGEAYNINATTLAKELVKLLGAKKLILVGDTPIYDKNHALIKTIHSELESKRLIQDRTITGGMITNCNEALDLLKYTGPGTCVQITSFQDSAEGFKSTGLLEELLGNGSGTQLIMPPLIASYPLVAVDKEELLELINRVFRNNGGKVLVDGYFENIKPKDPTVYLDHEKKGGAVSYSLSLGNGESSPKLEYVCKIFTHEDYEGMGIAASAINTILLQKGNAGWRAALKNTGAIQYYDKIVRGYNSKGFAEKHGDYMVFGIRIPKNLKETAMQSIGSIPKTVREV